MLITIGGLPGSGSSTVGKLLSKKLNRKRIDAGDLWDKMAKDHQTDVLGLNILAENDDSIDKVLDKKMLEIAKKHQNIILEGRLIGFFCKKEKTEAFTIWVHATEEIRIERLKKDGRISEKVIERERSEKKRYLELYNIDIDDLSVYDLVVDTGDKTPQEIARLITKELELKGI